jgi:hypothetical protein
MLNQLPKILDRIPKWVWFALGVAFLVGFALLVGYSSAQPPRYPQARSAAYGTEHESIQDISAQIVAYYTKVLAWFTAILALATMGLGASTIIQINLARREFLSTHRPKVRVKHLWLASDIWQGEAILVNLTLVNNGTAEGVFNEAGIKFFVVRNDRALPPEPAIPAILWGPGEMLCGLNLYFKNIGDGTILSDHDNVEIQNGRSKLYCVGYVSYLDSLKRMRITGFCRVLTFPGSILAMASNCRFRALDPPDPDFEYED